MSAETLPWPQGDPFAMTAQAVTLQRVADRLLYLAVEVDSAIDGADFDSPGARRFRSRTDVIQRALTHSEMRLEELARVLREAATEVARAQAMVRFLNHPGGPRLEARSR